MKTGFIRSLTAMSYQFGKKLTPALLELYAEGLAEYSDDRLVKACRVLSRGQFFPRIYDFLRVLEGDTPSTDDLANLRWSQIKSWVWGGQAFPDDPIAARALNLTCDAYMLRNADGRELNSYGFEFRAAYRAQAVIAENKKNEALLGPVDEQVKRLVDGIGRLPESEEK